MLIGIIIAIIVVAFIFIVMTYNALIAKIEAVRNSERQIDIQLDRRSKVFDSLINVVKKYMDYEKTTLKDVTALRTQANQAKANGDNQGRFEAENKISQIARGLNVQFENYPDLKANQNVLQLQEEITSTENKLAYAKQSYNDSIEAYTAHKRSFFASMVVGMFSKLNENFVYWQIDDERKETLENTRVEL